MSQPVDRAGDRNPHIALGLAVMGATLILGVVLTMTLGFSVSDPPIIVCILGVGGALVWGRPRAPGSRGMRTSNSKALVAGAGVAFVFGVSGCSAVGLAAVPTCSEYAGMSPDTGLMSALSDDQKSAINNILAKHDRKTDQGNQMIAATQVVAYCNIVSGVANSNADQPIDNIPGLSEE